MNILTSRFCTDVVDVVTQFSLSDRSNIQTQMKILFRVWKRQSKIFGRASTTHARQMQKCLKIALTTNTCTASNIHQRPKQLVQSRHRCQAIFVWEANRTNKKKTERKEKSRTKIAHPDELFVVVYNQIKVSIPPLNNCKQRITAENQRHAPNYVCNGEHATFIFIFF